MDTFLGSLVESCCGEGGTLQTNNTGMCLQCLGHTGFAPRPWRVCFPCLHCLGSRLLCQELRPALGCMHLPGLSHSGSGTQVLLKGTDSIGPAFCALLRSGAAQVMWCLVSAVAETYRLPHPSPSVFWVYNQCTFSGGC